MNKKTIFPIFYLPPISYMRDFLNASDDSLLENFEHFPKQTYRNRATILSPNGKLDLIVPVIKGSKLGNGDVHGHSKMKDVRISYDFDWQRLHWRSLESCYRSSAYFEYYEDELKVFYTTRYELLIDLNLTLFKWLLKKLKQSDEFLFTDVYEKNTGELVDKRMAYNKNTLAEGYEAIPYFQVFDDRDGFQPDLSIADLLFNKGPQAINFI